MGNCSSCWCCCCTCCSAEQKKQIEINETLSNQKSNENADVINQQPIQYQIPAYGENIETNEAALPKTELASKPKSEETSNRNKRVRDLTKFVTESASLKGSGLSTNESDQKLSDRQNKLRRTLSKKYTRVLHRLHSLNISEDTPPEKILRKTEIITKLLSHLKVDCTLPDFNQVYSLERLDENSTEYNRVAHLFKSTNKSFYKIHMIESVFNPYLFLQYSLKRLEYVARKKTMYERILFHGTAKSNIDSICRNNFNWRLNVEQLAAIKEKILDKILMLDPQANTKPKFSHLQFRHGWLLLSCADKATGKKLGTKNGRGVNFASNAYFATHYGDTGYNKVMIAALVLVGKCFKGYKDTIVPPHDGDTTTDHSGQVFVKYEDNVFYPAFLIHYGGIDNKVNNRGRGRGRGRSRGRRY